MYTNQNLNTADEKIAFLQKVLIQTHGQDGDTKACLSCPPGSRLPYVAPPAVWDIPGIRQRMRSNQEAEQRFTDRYDEPVKNALLAIGLTPEQTQRLMRRISRDCIRGEEFVELVKNQLATA